MLVFEVLLWISAAVGILIAGRTVLTTRTATKARTLPLIGTLNAIRVDTSHQQEQVESAYELLARVTDEEFSKQNVVAIPSRPPNLPSLAPQTASRPLIKGIVWMPSPYVVAEGGGLPAGGAVLRLHAPVAGIELLGIRGDSVVIKGRDSTWVLSLSAKQ